MKGIANSVPEAGQDAVSNHSSSTLDLEPREQQLEVPTPMASNTATAMQAKEDSNAQDDENTTPPRTPSILSLNNDILLLICTALATDLPPSHQRPPPYEPSPLKNLASTCHRLRDLAAPLIYRNVKLGAYGWVWDTVHEALIRMRKSEATLRNARRFGIDLYIGTNGNKAQSVVPGEGIFEGLLGIWAAMGKLERLDLTTFGVPEPHWEIMKGVFTKREGVKFESVKTLAIPCRMDWMVAKCPNLTCLEVRADNGTAQSPVEIIKQVPRIQHLECKARWTPESLVEVREAVPHVHTLAMQCSRPQYSRPVLDFIPTLASFPNLKCLVLEHLGFLNMGFSAPSCGNAYRGPEGWKVRERVKKDRERLSGMVAEAVFGKCVGLEELRIGTRGNDCRARVVRGEDGGVKEVRWSSETWEQVAGRV
ncbi:hypothetical protein PRZ48_010478 [Zasmidium cellare]|uniref:F-box domain-containing protein n=1 Tax=Zasmidium cellare TaxID=395010 RepID=A0ABR0E8T2_ZASCE|nr:hypothetical protein PRZ48_010478 [Zasmidium cellare]